ncbi:MAG TPA: aspartate/glutamate racemase family protein, partial [Burkholderiaceae bacterium]|nr:aspartate/glutamate racemase family protein [Burkholderiaceae bacterium]
MKLLLINPNISESVTALSEAEARRAASPGTTFTAVTAPFGVAYIETRFEALIGGYAPACLAGEHAAGHDAVIVAAFGDPGLPALREAVPVPVVGMTEAALATACLLGARFSIVAISRRIVGWYRDTVQACGVADRLAGVRFLDAPLRDPGTVQADHEAALEALCRRCVDEDGADVVILAGAPLAGLARGIRDRVPVPLVDGVSSAVRHAETLAALRTVRPAAGGFAP